MLVEPQVALVYSPRPWAEALSRFVADHGGIRIRAKVLDEAEALEQDYQVLVLDDITHFLSRRFVDEVHRRGKRVLGVYDPAELGPDEHLSAGKERLRACEVDDVLEAQATPAEFVASLKVLAATATSEQRLEIQGLEEGGPGSESEATPGGTVAVVAGASGGCGATEIAIGLAAAAAGRGERVVLVDADDVAPSVAQRLGLDVWPNIRAAVDAYQEAPERLLESLVSAPGGAFDVVTGLSNAGDWSALRSGEVAGMVRELARDHDHAVANVGPHVEDLRWLGEPERFGMTRGLLTAADVVVGVGLPTPVGVARLLQWASLVREVADGMVLHLVLNRSPAGTFRRAEVEQELRAAHPASVSFVPIDARVERAVWEGTLPEKGPFRTASTRLSDVVLPRAAPAPRRRLLRRAAGR